MRRMTGGAALGKRTCGEQVVTVEKTIAEDLTLFLSRFSGSAFWGLGFKKVGFRVRASAGGGGNGEERDEVG